jgi:hypothetical protein
MENFSIHEDEDRNYGLGLLSGNLRPVFERDFQPSQGKDIMGIHLSAVVRRVAELKTHEAYVEWFEANRPALFCSSEAESVLGARTVSEAGLEEKAAAE